MARIPRTEVVAFIQNYVTGATGVAPTSTVNIDDTPDMLRHSCLQTGVTFLQRFDCPVDNEEGMPLSLPYYYCGQCGKLYVYRHLYD